MIRVFRVADAQNLDLHPDAFAAVTRSLNLIGGKLRRDAVAARAFLDILASGEETLRTLFAAVALRSERDGFKVYEARR